MNKVAKRILIWVVVLGTLAALTFYFAVPMCIHPMWAANQRSASDALKSLYSAQADFSSNDRDENKIQDYWRSDVAGLYVMKSQGQPLKLIELSCALADDRPVVPAGPREPKAGYWFRAIRFAGESKPGPKRFAFCAFPEAYPKTGKQTFIINEDNTVYRKDLGAARGVEVWPADPLKEGWEKLD